MVTGLNPLLYALILLQADTEDWSQNGLLTSAFGLQGGTDERGGADSPVARGECALVICRNNADSAM